MKFVDPKFPLFVLVGLLVGEKYYTKILVPRVKRLKKKYLTDPRTILHSREIRRCAGNFAFLKESIATKEQFYSDLNSLISRLRVRVFAIAIDKSRLKSHYIIPLNPYDVSLSQLLSLVCGPPKVIGSNRPVVRQIIAESRGKREDKELQREFSAVATSRALQLWRNGGSKSARNNGTQTFSATDRFHSKTNWRRRY